MRIPRPFKAGRNGPTFFGAWALVVPLGVHHFHFLDKPVNMLYNRKHENGDFC